MVGILQARARLSSVETRLADIGAQDWEAAQNLGKTPLRGDGLSRPSVAVVGETLTGRESCRPASLRRRRLRQEKSHSWVEWASGSGAALTFHQSGAYCPAWIGKETQLAQAENLGLGWPSPQAKSTELRAGPPRRPGASASAASADRRPLLLVVAPPGNQATPRKHCRSAAVRPQSVAALRGMALPSAGRRARSWEASG